MKIGQRWSEDEMQNVKVIILQSLRSDLVDLREQNRRTNTVNSRILRLKIGQRWPEDEMRRM